MIEDATFRGMSSAYKVSFGGNEKFHATFGKDVEKFKAGCGNVIELSDVGDTYILVDDAGTEFVGILVANETVFDANADDIRIGKKAVTDDGVTTGTKVIPSYHTTEGMKLIPNGRQLLLPMDEYDFTKLQAIICAFNKTLAKSVAAQKVAINDSVYDVQSTDALATVTKYETEGSGVIDFGIENTSGAPYVIRFMTYKEVY